MTAGLLRKIVLGVAFLIIAVNVLGMLEVIPKLAPPRELNIVAIVLVALSLALRRRATTPRP